VSRIFKAYPWVCDQASWFSLDTPPVIFLYSSKRTTGGGLIHSVIAPGIGNFRSAAGKNIREKNNEKDQTRQSHR
jgi:hypothetical protein